MRQAAAEGALCPALGLGVSPASEKRPVLLGDAVAGWDTLDFLSSLSVR